MRKETSRDINSRSISARVADLVKFLSSVSGDLSNVTAPPSFLAPSSVVEVGHCWAQRPSVFVAPALEPCAEKRSLLVLRLILISLRSQLYVAGSPSVSIKKPLNAFLGELFFASWTDSDHKARTTLVSEQVSHHPPITAMHIASKEHGIRADGYARVEMTFSKNVNIRQIGHAILHIDRYNEDYLIPLPDVKVCGFLSGKLYPEVEGPYCITSNSGYISEIRFSGAGVLWGKKNYFQARVYHKDDEKRSIYEISGVWSESWTVRDGQTGETLEVYEVDAPENLPPPINIDPVEAQDPWESRRAWDAVLRGLRNGESREVIKEKAKIEEAQRRMRAERAEKGEKWEPLLFRRLPGKEHGVFHDLSHGFTRDLSDDKTEGVWRIDDALLGKLNRPFREGLTPLG